MQDHTQNNIYTASSLILMHSGLAPNYCINSHSSFAGHPPQSEMPSCIPAVQRSVAEREREIEREGECSLYGAL